MRPAIRSEPTHVTLARRRSTAVMASVHGYYGRAYDLWYGPRRDTVAEARTDAEFAADCIDGASSGVMV